MDLEALVSSEPSIEIVSEARRGSPLSKPKELKGLKPSFTYKWNQDVSFQVFVLDDDIWVKHGYWCFGKAWFKLSNVANVRRGHRAETIQKINLQCIQAERYIMSDINSFDDIMIKVWQLKDEGKGK